MVEGVRRTIRPLGLARVILTVLFVTGVMVVTVAPADVVAASPPSSTFPN